MPCGCFGKKNAQKKNAKNISSKEEASAATTPQGADQHITGAAHQLSEINGKNEDDPLVSAKRRDVVASYNGENCALLGYRPTGSRPPSCVDSPLTPSRTPSTAPIASSPSPSSTSASPSSTLLGASCRADLAEKRREFFSDFVPEDQKYFIESYHSNASAAASSTLPTIARARHFGEVRVMRPLSQPENNFVPPVPHPPSLPGPHLLRPTPPTSKIDHLQSHDESGVWGFSSPAFLRELRDASEDMSRRWGISHGPNGFDDTPTKTKEVPILIFDDSPPSSPNCPIQESHSVSTSVSYQPFTPPSAEDAEGKDAKHSSGSSHSISSSSSSQRERPERQESENSSDNVPIVFSIEDSSSHADAAAPNLMEAVEPSPIIYHTPSPILLSEGELAQEDVVVIDGEQVVVENIHPDSVTMTCEERQSDQECAQMSSASSSCCDIGLAAVNVEELQPILESDSEQELDHNDLLEFDRQHMNLSLSPASNDQYSKEFPSDVSPHETFLNESAPPTGGDFVFEKPAKISQTDLNDSTEFLIPEGEDLELVRQSSSDVD